MPVAVHPFSTHATNVLHSGEMLSQFYYGRAQRARRGERGATRRLIEPLQRVFDLNRTHCVLRVRNLYQRLQQRRRTSYLT